MKYSLKVSHVLLFLIFSHVPFRSCAIDETNTTPNVRFYERLSQKYPTCSTTTDADTDDTDSRPSPKCSLPADQLGRGNLVTGTSDRSDLFPPWINISLAQTGQRFYDRHFGAIFISYQLTGLFFMVLPQGAEILLFTGNSHTTEKYSSRFTATAAQFALWARDTLELGQNTENVKQSLLNVRRRHLEAVKKCKIVMNSRGNLGLEELWSDYQIKFPEFWDALAKDLDASSIPEKGRHWPESYNSTIAQAVPINQFLMAMVQWTLAGLIGGFPSAVLIQTPSPDDMAGFNHFMAVIGYALGIDDEYNIALQPTLELQTQMYRDILHLYFVPAMFQASRYSKILTESARTSLISAIGLGGMSEGIVENAVNIMLESLYIRILKDYVGIKATNLESTSSYISKAISTLYETILQAASYVPGFHFGLTATGNTLLVIQGKRMFKNDYTTDENISKYVFV